jgi:hypothetical protein
LIGALPVLKGGRVLAPISFIAANLLVYWSGFPLAEPESSRGFRAAAEGYREATAHRQVGVSVSH